jgi:hypothetical protein
VKIPPCGAVATGIRQMANENRDGRRQENRASHSAGFQRPDLLAQSATPILAFLPIGFDHSVSKSPSTRFKVHASRQPLDAMQLLEEIKLTL